jgi:tRNA modification GTPase
MIRLDDSIAAVITPPGRGAVAIIRVSGPLVASVAQAILGKIPVARQALFSRFKPMGQLIDEGVAIFFPGPHSFTGEDVLELQGHGGPVVVQQLLQAVLAQGVRLAEPGEFSRRAFLNNKMDLAQAEAIADLIQADSEQAAKSAMRSLQGEFSRHIEYLLQQLIELRVYVEAAIDFSDEEIDFFDDARLAEHLTGLLRQLDTLAATARQGAILREGMTVVIAGEPNAGKSSLLNALAGRETAIVTDLAGTTRDILREHIHIDGMPLHLLDTAGLRESHDQVEQEGIRRAREAIAAADLVLVVIDGSRKEPLTQLIQAALDQLAGIDPLPPVSVLVNKLDLCAELECSAQGDVDKILLSAKTGQGLNDLREHLKARMGYTASPEGVFMARRRHLVALAQAREAIEAGGENLAKQGLRGIELLAEELRHAQLALSEITGAFTTDDLLGEIFSSFCIGK